MSIEVPSHITNNINTLAKVTKALSTVQKSHVEGAKEPIVLTNGETSIRVDKTVEAIFKGVEMGAMAELIDDGQSHAVEMIRFAKHKWEERAHV
jgi:hypothetical protein